MRISPAGLDLIREFEGCRLTAYRDPVGILTIGYGSTGPHVYPGQTISQAQANALLMHDLARFETGVDNLVGNAPTTQAQFDAFVSFAFNCGLGALRKSTILKMHRAGRTTLAANAFMLWVNAGGRPLKGLIRRRAAERKLYAS